MSWHRQFIAEIRRSRSVAHTGLHAPQSKLPSEVQQRIC